ncbi:MAG: helix-turn-helix transcriptional regulator [Cyanobacteria bacterium J06623_4]
MKTAHPKAAALSVVDPHPSSTQTPHHIGILRAVLGSLQDGFIIASQSGHIHQINNPAQRICQLLTDSAHPNTSPATESNTSAPLNQQLPVEIWRICQSVLQNQDVLSFSKIGLDADIILPKVGTVRIRVQNIAIAQQPYLLIVMEDRQQTLRNRALSDAALYGLTERETEIWHMRLRGAAYKEISAALWISIDTVKKHVKNILAKQRSRQDDITFALMA